MQNRQSQQFFRLPAFAATVVLLTGLLFTLITWQWLSSRELQDARMQFSRLSERMENELQRRLQLPVYGLHGARGVYTASANVSRAEFRAYVDSRQLSSEFPGIRGFGFIERVMRADVDRFLAKARADGMPDFEIQTQGQAQDLLAIKYIEPLAANRAALGLDLGSEPVRREAVERAVTTGHAALSGRITLRQDTTQSPGFLLVVPIYRPGSDPVTDAQRWSALVGLVYAPIVAHEVLKDLDQVAEGLLSFDLYAGELASNDSHLYASKARSLSNPMLTKERLLSVGGSKLLLRMTTLPAFSSTFANQGRSWLALGGILLSMSLALVVWLLAAGRARAVALAREMTADLERLALVARATANAVIATDPELRITWVNEGFTRMTGFTEAEALGRTPGELLASGLASPRALEVLADAVASRHGCRVEILNRRKDGELNWVDTELQPVYGQDQQLTGFIEIALDITELKKASEQLWQERERLANIIEGTGAGTWEWNVQSGDVRFNERWAAMLGYTLAELEPVSFHTWTSLAHPEDLALSEYSLQQHLGGRTSSYEAELRVRHKNGEWVWVLTRGKLYAYTAFGEPLCVAGTHLDITERKLAEQALRASEAVLDRAGRIAGVGGWQIDLRDMRLHWSNQMFRLHDLEPQQQPTLEEALQYFSPEGRAAIEDAVQRTFHRKESTDLELRLTTATGREIWVRAVGEPELDGHRVVRINGTLQDITRRRELENATRRSNEVLRSVLDNLPCALSVFDAEQNLVAYNQQFRSLLEFPDKLFEPEARGNHVQLADIIEFNARRGEYGDTQDVEATVADIIERVSRPTLHQFERVRPNGAALEVRGAPMPGGGFVTTYIDISERKRMEAVQQRNSEQLRVMLESLPCALVVFDAGLVLRAFNDQFVNLLAIPTRLLRPGETQLSELLVHYAQRGDYGHVHDLDELVKARLSDMLELEQRQSERRRANGQTLEVRSAPMPGGGLVITYVDVSERKRMEGEQQRNAELMRVMLENLPCGLTMFDSQMRLTLHNPQYARMYELDDAFFANVPVTVEKVALLMQRRREYGDITTEHALGAAFDRAREAMHAPHYWERARPGGLVLEMRSAPLTSGGFVTTYTDVSEQRRAAAELAQALALLKAVLDAASKVAIIVTDRQRLIRVFNRGAELMVGYSAEEMVGRQSTEAFHVAEELEVYGRDVTALVGETLDGFSAMVHPSQLDREIECTYLSKDGRRIPAVRVVTEIRAADGNLYGYLGVAYDVSRQKQAEGELRAAMSIAEQASEAKSQFLANVSHEIRTPMNAILGMLKLLARTPLDDRQRDYTSKTEGAARSLLALLNDILDFSKIDAGKMDLDPQPFALSKLLEELRVILEANLGVKPVVLQFDLDPALPKGLLGDAMRLQQVLINLGGNAIKFTENGTVTIALQQLERVDGIVRIMIRVQDTGIGIAPENQSKIFAGFTQAEASTTRQFGGTGLGLAISQRLVEMMGGQLTLVSVEGHGSEFFFALCLPEAEAPVQSALERPLFSKKRLSGLRLLVAEDNPNNQQVVRELLEDEGALIVVADDGRQALEELGKFPKFDAVLMDVQMPVMDGYQATRAIRRDGRLARLPVIAMTANAMTADLDAARAAGMDEHVGKPFDLDDLVAVILRLAGRETPPLQSPSHVSLSAEIQQRGRAAGLNLQAALQRLMGKTELLARMSKSFAGDAATLPSRLRALIASGDLKTGAAELHAFKGLAATLGAERLAEYGRQGETRLTAGDPLEALWLDAFAHAVETDCAKLIELSLHLQGADSPAKTSLVLDRDGARADLLELMDKLRLSDMAALETLERLRQSHGGMLNLAALDEAIANLDFALAQQHCQQILRDIAYE